MVTYLVSLWHQHAGRKLLHNITVKAKPVYISIEDRLIDSHIQRVVAQPSHVWVALEVGKYVVKNLELVGTGISLVLGCERCFKPNVNAAKLQGPSKDFNQLGITRER
eukprot:13019809-Ditylum_brightwellii.AAC.1